MTEHKFKAGDKIKLKKDASYGGATGAIIATRESGMQAEAIARRYYFHDNIEYLDVEWTEREKFGGHNQADGGYYESDFEPLYGPAVKEVIKLELIPGNYGRFKVGDSEIPTPHVELDFLSRQGILSNTNGIVIDAKELREAAKLFEQLADYLESK